MSLNQFGVTATFLTLMLLAGTSFAKTTTKTSSKHTSSTYASHHSSTHKTSAKTSTKNSKHPSKQTATARSHGQHSIGEERTREIQSALIREHYLNGDATGVWDAQSKDAMTRYQEANGWQSKVTPDSRALIKLGLGPDHKDLLNPDTAVVASPHELGLTKDALPGGSASQ